jgi:hypothetical protein
MDESTRQQKSEPTTGNDFWQHFSFFSLRIDEYAFDHWYLFPILFYPLLLLFAFFYDLFAGNYESFKSLNNSLTKTHLTDWIYFSLVIALSLAVLLFNRWRSNIPLIFQQLLSKKRLSSIKQDCDINQAYYFYLQAYQRDLLSKKRYILSAITTAVCLPLFILIALIRYIPNGLIVLNEAHLYYTIVWIFWIVIPSLFCGYFFGVGAWVTYITGVYVKNLAYHFILNIQPSHPDNCGGLRVLGNLCLNMTLPILVGATLLGIFGIGGIIYPGLTRGLIIVPIAANIFLFLFALPLASITFFPPLWNIHREMISRKEIYEDEFAVRLEKLEKKMQSSLDRGDLEEAKTTKEEMEIVQVLHPDKIGYPTWPFDRRILLTLLTTQIVPAISLIINLSSIWIKH